MKQFLVIQTAFIGDVILATSLIETLKEAFPNSQIDFLVRKGNESLLHHHPHLRSVLIWDKKGAKYSSLLALLRIIRQNKYDGVINLQRFGATGLLTGLSRAATRIGFSKNPFSFLFTQKIDHQMENGLHEIERNHMLLSSLKVGDLKPPKLYPSKDDFDAVEPFSNASFVTLSPASVWFTKQLPVHKWVELINTFDKGTTVYLLGGGNDSEYANEILTQCPSYSMKNLCGKLTLLQSAALMSKAKRNYANDSAPMHLASAMNAPISAIYCSTIPSFGFGPLSDDSEVIEIQETLNCRPCGLHGKKACPQGHFNCAEKITFGEHQP